MILSNLICILLNLFYSSKVFILTWGWINLLFDNFSFDIDFGDMSQKDVDKMKQEEKEYNEELKKKEAEKKKGKWLSSIAS